MYKCVQRKKAFVSTTRSARDIIKFEAWINMTVHACACTCVCVRICNLSEVSQGSWIHGCFSPVKTAALKRKAGAQSASDPVTKATAVKPNVDRTKLLLQKERKRDGVKVKKMYIQGIPSGTREKHTASYHKFKFLQRQIHTWPGAEKLWIVGVAYSFSPSNHEDTSHLRESVRSCTWWEHG